MAQWVKYDKRVFNLLIITHFEYEYGSVYAYLPVGSFWEHEETTVQASLRIAPAETQDVADEIIEDIIRGRYDIIQ